MKIGAPLNRSMSKFRAAYVFLLVLTAVSAWAQAPNLKIRLYSLHSEQKIKILAKIGDLTWKSCEGCDAKHSDAIIVAALPQGLKIDTVKADGQVALQDHIFIEGNYRIEPDEGFALSLAFPLEIRAVRQSLKVLVTVPTEDYVAAVLAGESGDFQHDESLKAMAVAVRSYAAHFRPRHRSEGFDFCDSTHCQTLNLKGISSQVRSAVAATKGEMLWYQGSPAATFYHQNCGGTLAGVKEAWPDIHAPYLQQKADPYCIRGAILPWKAQLNRKQLDVALRAQGLTIPSLWNRLEIVSRTPSGRVLKLVFVNKPEAESSQRTQDSGQRSQPLISASTLRFAIGRAFGWNQVRSDLYEVQTIADAVIFRGRGAGHGVGLCQAGAEEMAKEGRNYRQILAFYYPGASLSATANDLAWQKLEGKRFEMLSTQPEQDREALEIADSILPGLESEIGWKLNEKFQLQIYPSLDAYRDSTGQPGWIAAFTRGQIIRLQPVALLKNKSILESTLRHELTHLMIESRAHAGTPLWFREGLALYFANARHSFEPVRMNEEEITRMLSGAQRQDELVRAYAAAGFKVAELIEKNGRGTVLLWLTNGLPQK